MGQGVVHVLRTHLVQGAVPDGVLFGEQVRQELHRGEESSEDEAESKCTDFPALADTLSADLTAIVFILITFFTGIYGCL